MVYDGQTCNFCTGYLYTFRDLDTFRDLVFRDLDTFRDLGFREANLFKTPSDL